jgi:NTP pyrophosphatase (non-canonical NTP hydrolase)
MTMTSGELARTVREAQRRAWANKHAKGFNTTDVPLEFGLLYGEVAEAFDAWRKDHQALGGELADVAIFLLGLAQMCGVDLQDEVEAKLAGNARRVYAPLPNGTLVKAGYASREAQRAAQLPGAHGGGEGTPGAVRGVSGHPGTAQEDA